MKKNIAFSIAGLATIPFGVYFAFSSSDNQMDAIASKEDEPGLEIATPIKYIASNEERAAAKKDIGEIADESTLIMRMAEMSLQKVNIGGKNFTPAGIDPDSIHRIQMTKGNIYYLKQTLDSIDVSRNTNTDGYSYESILNRWLEGNFEHVTKEMKFLLSLVSKPYGQYDGAEITKKNRIEEQEYIQKFFKESN